MIAHIPYRIHFIAIGGAAMHNLALELNFHGHHISGSDDEIYEPSRSRLAQAGILPPCMGWDSDRITDDISLVILGMHAKADNPELLKALELGISVLSYPHFIYLIAKHKKRIVVAGSHGKTTTTSMIMHAMKSFGLDFDYLVGAQVSGFERMVKISEAPYIIIEGDEYLSSPIHRQSKFHFYKPHLTVVTGIAWDHINVFPTFEAYIDTFKKYFDTVELEGTLIYFSNDQHTLRLLSGLRKDIKSISYNALNINDKGDVLWENQSYPIKVIGRHNLTNMSGALRVCKELGIDEIFFLKSMASFEGAARRLQCLKRTDHCTIYLDFAHAPSKVQATVNSVKEWYPDSILCAVLELHTFSSLNPEFLPQYAHTLDAADLRIVYFDKHTLEHKKTMHLEENIVLDAFGDDSLRVFSNQNELHNHLEVCIQGANKIVVLLMSSGRFGGMDLQTL